MLKDFSLSALTAGFLAVLISYAGPMVLMFQAASAAQISTEMMITWVWAISIGAAVSGIVLSTLLKVPVITAWSAPGSALLITLGCWWAGHLDGTRALHAAVGYVVLSLGFVLADMEAAVQVARATTLHAASLKDAGLPFSREASIAKLTATRELE